MSANGQAFRDRIVELRRVKASDLVPNPKNWRTHPEAQRSALGAMLADVGYADALIARETAQGLMLLDGHLRAGVAGSEEVPVLVVDLDDGEADRLLATLDPLAGMAVPDAEALDGLLEGLDLSSPDLLAELARLGGAQGTRGRTDADEAPPLPQRPTTKPGDLWLLGTHRLLCADAASPEAVRVLEEPDSLLVTDPPYGVDYSEVVKSRGGQKRGGWRAIDNDSLVSERLEDLVRSSLEASKAPTAFVWFGHAQRFFLERAMRSLGFEIPQEIVWVKPNLTFGRADYHWRHEQALYAKRKGHRQLKLRDQTTVWEVAKMRDYEHPTQKPVELYRIAIRNHTKPTEVVFDPFAGSGTVIVACEELGRRAAAVEIDPLYCDVAIKRWEMFTGEKAIRG